MTTLTTLTLIETLRALTVAALVERVEDGAPLLIEAFGELCSLDAYRMDDGELRLAVGTIEGEDRAVVLVVRDGTLGVVDALCGLPGAPASWPVWGDETRPSVFDALTAEPLN